MKRAEQFKRNNELFKLLMLKTLESDELRERIPDQADLVFLPENDAELREANLKLAEKLLAEGRKPVFVKISYVAETLTVLVPRVELVKAV